MFVYSTHGCNSIWITAPTSFCRNLWGSRKSALTDKALQGVESACELAEVLHPVLVLQNLPLLQALEVLQLTHHHEAQQAIQTRQTKATHCTLPKQGKKHIICMCLTLCPFFIGRTFCSLNILWTVWRSIIHFLIELWWPVSSLNMVWTVRQTILHS